ncbi:MAG: InlB B-repeat-containing protein, partial [Adlercreutzia sp.]|nr:InlB B-repeat-containing protein [Adlercreutzia sp.]
KVNRTFTNLGTGGQIRQVRWVVKACNTVTVNGTVMPVDANGKAIDSAAIADSIARKRTIVVDDSAAQNQPVPTGFRLAVDADPYTAEVEEADDVDPNRNNTGWEKQRSYEDGVAIKDSVVYRYVEMNLGNVENLDMAQVKKIGPHTLSYYGEVYTTNLGCSASTLGPVEELENEDGTKRKVRVCSVCGAEYAHDDPKLATLDEDCWTRTMQGNLIINALNPVWKTGTSMPSSITDNAAMIHGSAFISELPKVQIDRSATPLYALAPLSTDDAADQAVNLLVDEGTDQRIVDAVTGMFTVNSLDYVASPAAEGDGEEAGSTVAITYDGNGGSLKAGASMGAQNIAKGSAFKPLANQYTWAKHVFTGWNTASDGSGTAYGPEDTITANNAMTLYAQWVDEVRVTYDANGGKGTQAATTTGKGQQAVLAGAGTDQGGFTRDKYTFTGWNTEPDGSGTAYEAGQTITVEGNMMLYAQWVNTPQPITLTFRSNAPVGEINYDNTQPNAGDPNIRTEYVVEGQMSYTSFNLPINRYARINYTFAGWNTQEDGLGTWYNDKEVVNLTGDTVLYAQWSQGSVSDSVHVNHFATVVPRYDDTKYAQFERARAGFFRSDEKPTIKVEVGQWYFSGTAADGYAWTSKNIKLDPEDSLFLRYEIRLYNISQAQLRMLGYAEDAFPVDTCTNPVLSALVPRIQNYGPTPATMFDKLPALNAMQNARLVQAKGIQSLADQLNALATKYAGSEPLWGTDEDGNALTPATDPTRQAFVSELEALTAKLEAVEIISGNDVPTASKEAVENIKNIMVGQINALKGFQRATYDKDGSLVAPEHYDVTLVKPSDVTVVAATVGAQATSLTNRVSAERPYSRVLQYIPYTEMLKTTADGTAVSPLNVNYAHWPTSETSIDASPMNTQVPLWTYRLVKFKEYDIEEETGYRVEKGPNGETLDRFGQPVLDESMNSTIVFDMNDGEGGVMADVVAANGATITLPANNFTRIGYVFAGWNTRKDGTGDFYANQSQMVVPSESTVLYAQWTVDESVYSMISFDANGGGVEGETMDSQLLRNGARFYIPMNKFTPPEGQSFVCWNTKADGSGASYDPNQLVEAPEQSTV